MNTALTLSYFFATFSQADTTEPALLARHSSKGLIKIIMLLCTVLLFSRTPKNNF